MILLWKNKVLAELPSLARTLKSALMMKFHFYMISLRESTKNGNKHTKYLKKVTPYCFVLLKMVSTYTCH